MVVRRAGWFQAFRQWRLVNSRRCSGTSRSAALRLSRVSIAMIWRAYSLGHVTGVYPDGGWVYAELLSQPTDAGLFHAS